MAVRELWGADHRAVLGAAAACCDAELGADGRAGTGDPTELAILRAAAERGILRDQIEASNPRVAVTPFDSERKRMSIQRADGAPVRQGRGRGDRRRASTAGARRSVEAARARWRRAACGCWPSPSGSGPAEERLRLVGLIGIADPPRPEAIEAVAAARRAGIRTVMITGDHPTTAQAIAREMGIARARATMPAEVVHARADAGGQAEDRARPGRRAARSSP